MAKSQKKAAKVEPSTRWGHSTTAAFVSGTKTDGGKLAKFKQLSCRFQVRRSLVAGKPQEDFTVLPLAENGL